MLGFLGYLSQSKSATPLPVHSKLQALWQYWEECRQNSALPARSHFNAEKMIPWLPHISLVDVLRDPLRFRFRLMGTGCVRYAGGDHTGKWLDECVCAPDRNEALTPYVECIEMQQPVYLSGIHKLAGVKLRAVHRLYLPCTSDGTHANLIVLGVYAMELASA